MNWFTRLVAAVAAVLVLSASAAFAGPNPVVVMETNKGTVMVMLYADKAPNTVENFMKYVDAGFYENVLFHRVIPGFVIQGGGFGPGMKRLPTAAPVKYEYTGLKNLRGTLSMARTNDPDSATSQFFVNLVDNEALDGQEGQPGYAVFGKVVRGMEVVDEIAATPTGNQGMFQDVPRSPVYIKKAYRYDG